jgi:thiol-disulfide isomerase/thioredoxin
MSVHMPSLDGAGEWLDGGPPDLGGRVVLVNFWTLTCINWLRQEPYVRAWSRAYRDDGLVVIGAHTPEFSFEHDVAGVRRAVAARDIDYPVVVDNDYEVWDRFSNRYWPALYFADRDGVIRDEHFGEGRYEESERVLQELLGVSREPVRVVGEGIEAAADWDRLRTPETYLGAARGERSSASRDGLRLNHWAAGGDWTIARESVVLGTSGGSLAFRFDARDAHLVLNAATPIPFRVTLDGEPPGASSGVDTNAAGEGMLDGGRLYQLVRRRDGPGERTLEITFLESGAEAYAFTFG